MKERNGRTWILVLRTFKFWKRKKEIEREEGNKGKEERKKERNEEKEKEIERKK